ncbi:uncharacterized protein [Rutidosis leptorrhynchoides]|uniref:uncharacterized protein n=1 Tax=Rutidosis leptorrhynchoides TaxID=125765 RepID=UPI003A98DA2C
MWASLEIFLGEHDDAAWILGGDFNEVRHQSERQNCEFVERRAKWFNEFINKNQLIEVPMGGKWFTRIRDNGINLSKLDRFLISESFNLMWEELSVLALERKLFDHCPKVLRDWAIDFGSKPTKVFNEWLETEGEDKVVNDAWSQTVSN